LNFIPLLSSSKGNVYIVSDSQTRILLECGVTHKKLQQMCGFHTTEFDACIISHEHKDHSTAVKQIITSGVDVYMSNGTAAALELPEKLLDLAHEMVAGEQFTVGTIDVLPFPTLHDAKEPLGFVMQSRLDGDILAYAIDTVNLPYNFPGVNLLAVEANFEQATLERCERMPEKVRHRIANTHMEIDVLCRCLQRMDLSRCRELYLLHLSDATSHEGHFINKVARAVPRHVRVSACPR
jgi:phosphoribosyl 1,2-cyclic phosphodiesterase